MKEMWSGIMPAFSFFNLVKLSPGLSGDSNRPDTIELFQQL
jgi:hypothetical protein